MHKTWSSACKPPGASNELSDSTLDEIASEVAVNEQTSLGIKLGFSYHDVRRTNMEIPLTRDATLALLVVSLSTLFVFLFSLCSDHLVILKTQLRVHLS